MAEDKPSETAMALQKESGQAPSQQSPPVAPATGRRSALDDLKIQLTEEELASSGARKLILELLAQSEEECERLKIMEANFHAADKQVGILTEELKTNRTNEVMFGCGVGVGCAVIGLAPFLWGLSPDGHLAASLALIIGGALTIGAALGRIFFK